MKKEEYYYHKLLAVNGIGELPKGILPKDAVNVEQLEEAITSLSVNASNGVFINNITKDINLGGDYEDEIFIGNYNKGYLNLGTQSALLGIAITSRKFSKFGLEFDSEYSELGLWEYNIETNSDKFIGIHHDTDPFSSTGKLIVRDSEGIGLSDVADYSANKTDWSYITKKWTEDTFALKEGSFILISPEEPQDASINIKGNVISGEDSNRTTILCNDGLLLGTLSSINYHTEGHLNINATTFITINLPEQTYRFDNNDITRLSDNKKVVFEGDSNQSNWGDIEGTIEDQTDLINELNKKATLNSNTFIEEQEISYDDFFVKISNDKILINDSLIGNKVEVSSSSLIFYNNGDYTNTLVSSNLTSNKVTTFQDKTGTVALLSDIVPLITGTWTPTSTEVTLSILYTYYQVVGNMVTAFFRIIFPISINNTPIIIKGLPKSTYNYYPLNISINNSGLDIYGETQTTDSAIVLKDKTGTGITYAQMSEKGLAGSVTYRTP